MPELPEVEVAARNLRRWLKGPIAGVKLASSRILRGLSPASLARLLVGRRVVKIDRRGKWLRLALDGGGALYSHLGMTGKWVRRGVADPAERFERARVDVGAASVRYLDPRLFGRLVAAPDGALAAWDALGPDPLVDGIDAAELHARLARIARSIKEVLLDQALLAGVGNIQAAESLWLARIDPRRRASSLSKKEVTALVRGIDRSIADTLAHEDGPEIHYVEEAGAPNPFRVYGKHGEPCPRCRTTLKRIVQGGRSTVFCPRCQRAAQR